MSEVRYEKPSMKYVSLRNESNVADTCWGHHNKGTTLYCDIDGPGWTSFQIAAGSCSLNLINVYYYTDTNGNGKADKEDEGILIASDEKHVSTEYTNQYTSLFNKLKEASGSDGNSFKGESEIYVPDNPTESWS